MKTINLETSKHVQLYKISWVLKETDTIVTKMCGVIFSPANILYVALSIWMHATLFFEDHSNLIWMQNVYILEWKGRKLCLLPTTPSSTHVNTQSIKKSTLHIINGTKLINAYKCS